APRAEPTPLAEPPTATAVAEPPAIAPTETQHWFYEINGRRAGPASAEAVRELFSQGVISIDTPVWNKTFGQRWKPLRETNLPVGHHEPPPPVPTPRASNTPANFLDREVSPRIVGTLVVAALVLGLWAYSGFPLPKPGFTDSDIEAMENSIKQEFGK